jgi:hypothetical protein
MSSGEAILVIFTQGWWFSTTLVRRICGKRCMGANQSATGEHEVECPNSNASGQKPGCGVPTAITTVGYLTDARTLD